MAYVVMAVACTHCREKQRVHVAARPGFNGPGAQTVACIKCEGDFDVMVPDKIVGGPFPA
jgi:hypothetical protein